MKVNHFAIEGLVEVIPDVFEDERGYFLETFHREKYADVGIKCDFLQSNQSFSTKNVMRGLHFQNPPFAQAKLVKVVVGRALDIAVDIRKDSPTFGQYCACELSADKMNLFFIPEGFAHGFLALEDCIFQYMCSNIYNKASEEGIIWNDPDLNIDWGVSNPLVSEKDLKLQTFNAFSKD